MRPLRSEDYRLLGSVDDAGTDLLRVFGDCLNGLEVFNEDHSKVVRCISAQSTGDELLSIFQHGQSGVVADIVSNQGNLRLRQVAQDSQLLRCGCIFLLPRDQDTGFLALHVNNGRGIKSLLEKGLTGGVRSRFDDLKLELNPFVHRGVLEQAVHDGQIDKVRLIKTQRPEDAAVAATRKWIRGEQTGKLELDITATGRAQRVRNALVDRFLGGDADAFDEIVEFEGIRFDEAKVEVVLPNDARRTFNIENPSAGHPFTVEMEDLALDQEGEPSEESVFAQLRVALALVR